MLKSVATRIGGDAIFTTNPFAELSAIISLAVMQASGKAVGGGEKVSMMVKTALVDVAASGEFCNLKRRIARLLGMYGFISITSSTEVRACSSPRSATRT